LHQHLLVEVTEFAFPVIEGLDQPATGERRAWSAVSPAVNAMAVGAG